MLRSRPTTSAGCNLCTLGPGLIHDGKLCTTDVVPHRATGIKPDNNKKLRLSNDSSTAFVSFVLSYESKHRCHKFEPLQARQPAWGSCKNAPLPSKFLLCNRLVSHLDRFTAILESENFKHIFKWPLQVVHVVN